MLAFSLESTHHHFGHGVGPSPRSLIVPLAVLALILFAVKYFGVIAHEGAHAIAGWSMGRKVASVKLNSDATGVTRTLGADKGLGRIFTAFAGLAGDHDCCTRGWGSPTYPTRMNMRRSWPANVGFCRKLVALRPVGKCGPLLGCRCQFRLCVLVQLDAGGRHVLLQVPDG
jgi:hypothetical protein